MPHKDRVNGTIAATKPLAYRGSIIDDFSITYRDGKVVDFKAAQGEDALRTLLTADEGASRIGEVALVPHSSPISQTGRIFYNILIDENASNHIAIGNAYQFTMRGGSDMDPAEFEARGGNRSKVHVDFMVGSGKTNIDGITRDGDTEPLMQGGEWVFAV
jgi:aminopeptidase